jgi:hypothetical protein
MFAPIDYLFLFPARVLGPASDGGGGGEEGGEATIEEDVSDDSNLYVRRRDGEVFEQSDQEEGRTPHTISKPDLQDFGKIALGFGLNPILSHRLFCTLRMDYKL